MSTIKTTNIQHPSAASPAVELTAAGGLWLGGGKILQVVRATDSTTRSTTSTSFVDVTGMSVTISPQKSDSSLLIVATYTFSTYWTTQTAQNVSTQITDSSDNPISGAENAYDGSSLISGTGTRQILGTHTLIGFATPATTSAVTYKMRYKVGSAGVTNQILNGGQTGQMYAIEVSA